MPDLNESRNEHSHPLGPLDSELKLRIPSELADKLRKESTRIGMGMGMAELVRAILIRGVYGKATFEELHSRLPNAVDRLWGDE